LPSPPHNRKNNVSRNTALRRQLARLLRGGEAHVDAKAVLAGWPAGLRGTAPKGAPHTAWQLLEHLRIAQRDILDYSHNPAHISPPWPAGYWPATAAPPTPDAWSRSVKSFLADSKAMQTLVGAASTDLLAKIRRGAEHTILREAFVLADHNAYTLGQLVLLRRQLGAWKT
jgi:hypothetical protein